MMTVTAKVDRHEGMMYAKLYSTILRSSIWLEDANTRLLWIAMLAAADEQGFVFGSPAGMAHTARIPAEAAKVALAKLAAPDPDSSDLSENPENEGRRIEVVDGGWRLINYARYRAIRDSEERRDQNREAKRRQRERESAKVSHGQPTSAEVSPSESEAESESDTESDTDTEKHPQEGRRFAPPTLQEAKSFFESEHLSGSAEAFFHHFEAVGWRSGRTPLRKWKSAAHKWSLKEGPVPTGKAKRSTDEREVIYTGLGPQIATLAPSGDYRLPTGGYAAADLSWFDYKGERYFKGSGGSYRNEEGYAPDGSHKQNIAWTDSGGQRIVDRILAMIPKVTP